MKLPRYLRLLPTVVVVGASLFVVKTTGLVHEAYAEAAQQVATLTADPKPAHEDFAGAEDEQVASANDVDVMNALGKRRKELATTTDALVVHSVGSAPAASSGQ